MKKIKIALITFLSVSIIFTISFFVYVNIYYKAEQIALDVLDQRDDIVVTDDITYIPSKEESKIGLIFYPGAKVESNAYLPLLDLISEEGINCFLIDMPFNLAFFGSNSADEVLSLYQMDEWYIAGHSLGGAMASNYASKNQDIISGLILLGAYIYKDYPIEQTITIYGEFDQIMSELDYETNVFMINGGNHANFGCYGNQANDGVATISKRVQREQTTNIIAQFVKNIG